MKDVKTVNVDLTNLEKTNIASAPVICHFIMERPNQQYNVILLF